jgi:RNA recognition motif-containing protein
LSERANCFEITNCFANIHLKMSMNEGCKALYVGNLDSRVTDYMLYEIFSVVGQVDNVKIIMDRNVSSNDMTLNDHVGVHSVI